MSKENLKQILETVYKWLLKYGLNETLLKVLLGASFGIIATFMMTACKLNYEGSQQKLNIEILKVEEFKK